MIFKERDMPTFKKTGKKQGSTMAADERKSTETIFVSLNFIKNFPKYFAD